VIGVPAGTPVRTALTIAGSDPSGGAGLQADLKTFSELRVYGMAVVTAITVQNTLGVSDVGEVSTRLVEEQLASLLSDIPPDATKTGMLLTAGVVRAVAEKAKQFQVRNLVVDPVMISSSGTRLMQPDAVTAFQRDLLPLAFLVTPNIDEASELTQKSIRTIAEMEQAARSIHDMGAKNVLIKGGHLEDDEVTDVLFDGREIVNFRAPRVPAQHTHGTGCVLSAAITAHLALGRPLKEAVDLGKQFVTKAIRNGLQIGGGIGPCDPLGLKEG
jgi:hydroxymethylpyrimidine/phosphomethylpyrimidine kinase